MPDLMLFAGNSVPHLAQNVASHLNLKLSRADVGCFSDGETRVEILENVRGRDVFVIQSTCPPTNNNLMELVVMVDALRRASAGRITAVMPYFGYGRQDRRARSARVPITARVVADMLAACGVDRILTVDIHAEQIQGFFHIPVDNVYGMPILYDYWKNNYPTDNLVIVSPDIGGVVRARAMAKKMNCDLAIIDKRRPRENESVVMNIIGEVAGRHCVVVDDIVDTAGTLCKGAEALIAQGALKVSACCLHPVLSGKAIQNIENSHLFQLIVTDSIPLSPEAKACGRIHQISISHMLSETIRRINTEESISMMFQEETDI